MNISSTEAQKFLSLIRNFNNEQMDSLLYYAGVLKKAYEDPDGPQGKVIRNFMNVDCKVIGPKTLEARMPIRREMFNIQSILHGGTLATFIDFIMGQAIKMLYPKKIAKQVTVALTIHYLGVGRGDELKAQVELVQAGNSLCVLESSVFNDQCELITRAVGTFKITKENENS